MDLEKAERELRPRQLLFCYLLDRSGNATQSYMRAGYKGRHSRQRACDLRRNPKVKRVLDLLAQLGDQDVSRNRQRLEDCAWDTLDDALAKHQLGTVAKMLEFLQKWYPTNKDPAFETIEDDFEDEEAEYRRRGHHPSGGLMV